MLNLRPYGGLLFASGCFLTLDGIEL